MKITLLENSVGQPDGTLFIFKGHEYWMPPRTSCKFTLYYNIAGRKEGGHWHQHDPDTDPNKLGFECLPPSETAETYDLCKIWWTSYSEGIDLKTFFNELMGSCP